MGEGFPASRPWLRNASGELMMPIAARFPLVALLVAILSVACAPAGDSEAATARLATSTPDPGRTWYVGPLGADSNDCRTPTRACRFIQTAIERASPGDAVVVLRGRYLESNILIDRPLRLRGAGPLETVVGAAGRGDVLVVNLPTAGGVVVVEGMTLEQAGSVSPASAIRALNNPRLWVRNTVLRSSLGRGITLESGMAFLVEVEVLDNRGSGIYVGEPARLSLVNSLVMGNGDGGIVNYGNLLMWTTTVRENRGHSGSGITNLGVARVERSTIHNNLRPPGERIGEFPSAGISNFGILKLVNSTVSHNGEAGIVVKGGQAELIHVTVVRNGTTGLEGFRDPPDPKLGARPAPPVVVRLVNSLIVSNGTRDCDLRRLEAGDIVVEGHSIDSDNTCTDIRGGRAAWGLDPGVGPLADNGGRTWTHALVEGSAAIDVSTSYCEALDQRGMVRPMGRGCDAGAYEYVPMLAILAEGPERTGTPMALPTSLPSEIATAEEGSPSVRLMMNANCRSGPGLVYGVVTSFYQGVVVPIEGRNADSSWWLVRLPTRNRCWVSNATVEVLGAVDRVALVAAPPTPTPRPALEPPAAPQQLFIASRICTGQAYSVTLQWFDAAVNEDGYRVYRDGQLVATLGANAAQYVDAPPGSGPYTYGVEAYNAGGISSRTLVLEAGCVY